MIRRIYRRIGSELAADILENMEADDAVDILDELEDEKERGTYPVNG